MNSEIISIMTAKKIHNYDRVIELLLYALLPKELYNRELDRDTKRKYINIIENNLKEDTYTISDLIKREYKKESKIVKGQISIFELGGKKYE